MKPIKFREFNKELQKPVGVADGECGALPIYGDGMKCISCWQPSFRERLSILLFGRVWLWVFSGETQPPVALEGTRSVFMYGIL